jgi:hypothetical protein
MTQAMSTHLGEALGTDFFSVREQFTDEQWSHFRIMAAPACRVRPAQWRQHAAPDRAGRAGAGPPARSASIWPYPAGLGPSKGVA